MSQHSHAHPELYETGQPVYPVVRDLDTIRDGAKYAPPEPDESQDCGHAGTRFACDTCTACRRAT